MNFSSATSSSLIIGYILQSSASGAPGFMLRLRRKYLVSAVMTTRAESRISHGLLVVRNWLWYLSADVALISIVFGYHMYLR
jgi:hypothetical protein